MSMILITIYLWHLFTTYFTSMEYLNNLFSFITKEQFMSMNENRNQTPSILFKINIDNYKFQKFPKFRETNI